MGSSQECGGCTVARLLGLESRTNSLALFVSVNLFYFLVFAMGKSMVSLLCYLCLAPVMLGLLLKALHLTPTQEGPWEIVSRSGIESKVEWLYDRTNQFLEFCRDVCLWKNVFFTTKVCCALLTLGYVSSFLSFASLVFVSTWSWFLYSSCSSLFHDTIYPVVSPYIKLANQAFHKVFQSIPKMEVSDKKH
ncbi:reticulon domain-containing protein, putative [Eimeria tenella]|uniref:Reticulon domain-containing protein, putative n=1 Tax=Eimeria tenella TaxID=5802 RepID=H9B984_EIMTE|nr:reticulon domain-containing protein, putative [Eimeria tenella]AET50544.1 hypothetical protein [Eimeria tenella]CDJ43312.1 reticulon domain-containing protein, putative [Eimeria tenella]|eukprot:XP_013234062.1 reticulon domain-containing protein, putative [Eimeria tenella]